ncbi:MAG TPA: hypothetical protein VLH58_11145, partial [Candidatus Methylomirabilis sp.]|nr:hypothetical protein [Candidatus Methylomirabilis sp.]
RQAVLAIGYLLTSQGVPCVYYGTEQGFDGGGDNDRYVRECMFGGRWGAFETTGRHCFNPRHAIYRRIAEIAAVRRQEVALRYGRQYFREISGNGKDFGYPIDGNCTLAFSRILDTSEILVAMNLSAKPRKDHVSVDVHLSPAGATLVNLLQPTLQLAVERRGPRNAVRIPLEGHELVILKAAAPTVHMRPPSAASAGGRRGRREAAGGARRRTA